MKWWHEWRARVYARKLLVQEGLVQVLMQAEKDYRNHYYTDKLHQAFCRKIELASAVKFHQDKASQKG